MTRATFRKNERLTGRDAFTAVVKRGKAVNEAPFRLVGLITSLDTTSPAQVAFAVPKRFVKHAVVRNRIRRLMREAYRTGKEKWYEPLREAEKQCAWLFIYQAKDPITLAETRTKFSNVFERWFSQHLNK